MLDLTPFINNRSLLNEETLEELRRLVEAYPFYQSARLLYILNLHIVNDVRLEAELKKASVLVPDRSTLFGLIEETQYDIEHTAEASSRHDIETEDDNRTISLIDNYLSTQEEDDENDEKPLQPHSTPTVAEVTSDYGSFLLSQEQEEKKEEVADNDTKAEMESVESPSRPQLKGASLIDNFIEEQKGKQRYEISGLDESAASLSTDELYNPLNELEGAERDALPDLDIYNENIVNILIKQGKYEQGLLILKKICLNNPEKNANFANQIRLLEVIIRQKQQSATN